jgi:CheY-like chemotaxis protein
MLICYIQGMPPAVSTTKTCLCIDLDADFYYLMQSYAQRSKFLRLEARPDQEADPDLTQRPDVIFLEADNTAGQKSWDKLHALKVDTQTRQIPVILFSWLAVEARALEEGADAFLQKPVMYADLLDALALVGISSPQTDTSPERR